MNTNYLSYLSFETKQDVLDFLKEKEAKGFLSSNAKGTTFNPAGTYYLSHGEYARPEYTPRRYKDGWGVHAKHFYYGGTLYAPRDGRLEYDPWE